MDFATILMTVSIAVFTGSQIVQSYRVIKRKSSDDISLWFIGLMEIGLTSLLLLVIVTDSNWKVITERSVGLVGNTVLFFIVHYYKPKRK